MRILMVGAGATGGFYGGMLAKAGRDITFLLRPRRAAQVREQGLQVAPFQAEPITLQPKVVTAEELRREPQTFDLVVISTKSYQLEGAMDDIAPAIGPETMILPILNGMRQFDILQTRFGAPHVIGGSVRIVADMDPQGRIHQTYPLDQMNYGELSGERTQRLIAVDEVMQGAGFEATLQPDIVATLWQKWVILSSMGAICILARGTAGQVGKAARGQELASAVVHECGAIAAANGYAPKPELLDMQIKRMTEPGSSLTSSMYRDMMKGAPVEADHILGDLLDRAKDVAAPLLTAAYVQLKVYEASRNA